MSNSTSCLNCETKIVGKFCFNCGQKTDTHRITFKHFIFHDILHGVWHVEKGILFTLKEALIRPGKAALDYISGKRIRYYNVFYLTLLLIGLNIFLIHIENQMSHYYFNTNIEANSFDGGYALDAFLTKYSKLIIFGFIPLLALNSYFIFRKRKFNLSEHSIIAGIIFLGIICITLLSQILSFLQFIKFRDSIFTILNYLTPLTIIFFTLINYYKTFKTDYSKSKIIFKIILFTCLIVVELILLVLVLIGFYTDWGYKLKTLQ